MRVVRMSYHPGTFKFKRRGTRGVFPRSAPLGSLAAGGPKETTSRARPTTMPGRYVQLAVITTEQV